MHAIGSSIDTAYTITVRKLHSHQAGARIRMGKHKGYIATWDSQKRRSILKATYVDFRCKLCNSEDIVKYGSFRGMQYWWCKSCRRKFADNEALPQMKTPMYQVASTLRMYYEGMSLNSIRRHLDQMHNNNPSNSTLYDWITRFTESAVTGIKSYKPAVGDTWIAEETVIKIEKENAFIWDIMDSRTRFLLASRISQTQTARDAFELMEQAINRAGKIPKLVFADSLKPFLDEIVLNPGMHARYGRRKNFKISSSKKAVERLRLAIEGRTKIVQKQKKLSSAELVASGYAVFYNFVRPQDALGDKTPAEKAGVEFPYTNWPDMVDKESFPAYLLSYSLPTQLIPSRRADIQQKSTVKQARRAFVRT